MRLSNVRRILFVIGCLACLLAPASVNAADVWWKITLNTEGYVYQTPEEGCDAYIEHMNQNYPYPPYTLDSCTQKDSVTYRIDYSYMHGGSEPPEPTTGYDTSAVQSWNWCDDNWHPDTQTCETEPYDNCPAGEQVNVNVPLTSASPDTIDVDGCQYSYSGGVSVCAGDTCLTTYTSSGESATSADTTDYDPSSTEPTAPPRETTETESFETGTSDAGNPTETTTTEKTIPSGTEVTDSPDTVEYEQWPDDSYTKTTTTQETIDNGDGTQTVVTTETTEYFQSAKLEGRKDKATGENTTISETPAKSDSGTTVTSTTTDSDGTVISKNKTYEQGESSEDIQEQGEQDMGEGDCGVLPEMFCTILPNLSEKFNEFFDDMGKIPDGVGDEIALPTQEIENPGTAAYSSGLGGASCPQPAGVTTTYGSMSPSYQPFCDLAVKINPYLIAMAYLMAAFIVLGVRK